MADRSSMTAHDPVPVCLRECLQRAAHYQPPLHNWSWPQQSSRRPVEAAILMPFFASRGVAGNAEGALVAPDQTPLQMLLTRRARHLRRHAGQMSFPGGVAEHGDDDLLATAIRETTEETGIHGDFIQPLGKLGDMITISGYRLHVFAGWLRPGFAVDPDPNEVEALYATEVATALDVRRYRWRLRETPAGCMRMPEMYLEQQLVWGITAVIIWHLSCLWHQHSNQGRRAHAGHHRASA